MFGNIRIGNKVGANGSKLLSELNFAEQIETIKNKINYWKGKGLSLITRVRITYFLSYGIEQKFGISQRAT